MSRKPRGPTPAQVKAIAELPRHGWADAKLFQGPAVYGLIDLVSGRIVYVGRAKSLYRRMEAYRYNCCHNELVSAWLETAKAGFVILEAENDSELEIGWISALPNLFNLATPNCDHWRHVGKPWAAGTGMQCPSAYMLSRSRILTDEILLVRLAMSENERCRFEIGLCMDMQEMPFIARRFERWLDIVTPKMVKALEHASA